MAKSFVEAMDDEIAMLEAELQADPRYAKLRELKHLRRHYQPQTGLRAYFAHSVGGSTRGNPDRDRILDTAASIISGRSYPTPTADILSAVVDQGLEVHGQNPRNTLSAMLSNSPRFQSHQRSGWTLVEPDQLEQKEEAADDDLLAGNPSTASEPTPSDQRGNTDEASALGGGR